MSRKIGVIGLGYVGMPLALALAAKHAGTVGFDINQDKVEAFKKGQDVTGEGFDQDLKCSSILWTCDVGDLRGCDFLIVAVPTPLDSDKRPDLGPLIEASRYVGSVISQGAIVVFESTVYPGVTEDICGPIIAEVSRLKPHVDFKLGYSPERVNPGDKEHTLERVTKVVSAEDADTLETVASIYESVVSCGVYRAPSIKVAEAAKVIENTQRDLNIALMNELAIIFDLMKISTKEVIKAAATKWNFLPFSPGLVGGHCIGVDPYYLTVKAEQLGYRPQVILAGRRINDGMGKFVAQRTIKLMINSGIRIKGCRIGVLGITFKENVADVRNSRVPDILRELHEYGVAPLIHDPLADASEVRLEYGINLAHLQELQDLDALILAVAHAEYLEQGVEKLCARIKPGGIMVDVKGVFENSFGSENLTYWSL
ncbi:MAG: nucleotide sugar dehydrogenase [Deltaproteobacteria bacterium]|nr:nucleotide sugar dehydrogenase [Deltaproteobacteria bacterium]